MKTILGIFFAILLLTNCVGKTTTAPSATSEPIAEKAEPLLIGGKYLNDYTLEDADSLERVTLSIDPDNPLKMYSLENIELLTNLRVLSIKESNLNTVDLCPLIILTNLEIIFIHDTNFDSVDLSPLALLTNLKWLNIYDGKNLASVDLSPLSSLLNLEELFIDGNISKLPDLTPLSKLKRIVIKNSDLESLDGLGAPFLEHMDINMKTFDSLAPLSNLTKLKSLNIVPRMNGSLMSIGNLSNVPSLEFLTIQTGAGGGSLDITGIEKLTGLAHVNFDLTELVKPQGISGLRNLETLSMTLTDENPSIEYLRDLQNLDGLYIEGDSFWRNKSRESYQVLDVSPLGDNHNLKQLRMRHLIIKNIASLDNLKNLGLGRIDLLHSRLFDETEKSVHYLMFTVEE